MTDGFSRDDHVYMAKLAEQAERYDDMVSSMKEVSTSRFKTNISPYKTLLFLTNKNCYFVMTVYRL